MNTYKPGDKAVILPLNKVITYKGGGNWEVPGCRVLQRFKKVQPVPLIKAIHQSDGTVRECNQFGEYPKGGEFADEGSYEAWREADQERRTWEVQWTAVANNAYAPFSARFGTLEVKAGTTILGYEHDGRFVIVEVVR